MTGRKQAAVSSRACPVNDVGSVAFWNGQSHAVVSTDIVECILGESSNVISVIRWGEGDRLSRRWDP